MSTLRAPAETDLSRFYAIFPQPAMARDLFNIVEGHRVDAAIGRAYPGIRRDMAKIQAASAERRPDLATLSDAQAVVEALLQHTLGLTPDLADVPPATQALIAEAVAMLGAVAEEGATVGDAATLTADLYQLIDEGLQQPANRMPQPQPDGADGNPPPPDGMEAPPQGAAGVEDYEQMELPPFMTPVMEELVRPPSDAPVKREAQGAEPQEDGTGEKQVEEKELPEGSAEKAMRTTEVEAGRGGEDEVAEQTASEDQDGPPGTADGQTQDADGGGSDSPEQTGLGDVAQQGRRPAGGGPRRAGLPVRRVGPQDRGLPPRLVHPHRAPPDAHPGGVRRGDVPRVRRDRHPDPAQLPADAPRGAAEDALPGGRRRPRHRRPRRVRRQPQGPGRPHPPRVHQARQARPGRHHRVPGGHVQLDGPQDRRPQADHRHREGGPPPDVRGPRGDPRRVRHLRLLRVRAARTASSTSSRSSGSATTTG